jgi:gluconolactonase
MEKIATGFRFTEGPVFSRRGYLLFSDIPASRIMKWEKGGTTVYRENSNGANGLTFDHQGRLLACERGRVTRTEKDGGITVLAEGKGPNDLVYAIDGSIYFSDLPASTVYQITPRGQVRAVARDCQHANGVALAPNQQKLYVGGEPEIRVYDIAPDGELRNSSVFAVVATDGLKTDEAGDVWVAAPDGIRRYNRGGQLVETLSVPERPSNLNWGAGFRDLYVTAHSSVYKLPAKAPGTRTY